MKNTPSVINRLVQPGLWIWVVLCLCACSPINGNLNGSATRVPATKNTVQAVPGRTHTAPTPANPSLWVENSVPGALRGPLAEAGPGRLAGSKEEAKIRFGVTSQAEGASVWVYALVVPFSSVLDQVSTSRVMQVWQGAAADGQLLLLSETTRAAFSQVWGAPAPQSVLVMAEDAIKKEASLRKNAWVLLPFEALDPTWKVLKIDSGSPLQKNLELDLYPLKIYFGFSGDAAWVKTFTDQADSSGLLPKTNRDPQKLTVLVMTGVTALVRGTADRMEKHGNTYPAGDIVEWLRDADLTHISNEVSFNPACPPPNPADPGLVFCSAPKYLELLDYVHANIIEMTGNHLNDFGREALLYTLALYRQRGWQYYGAGENIEKARRPITVIHNGNWLAFLGCNPAGPQNVWATADQAGAADCNYDWMQTEISALRARGYLPIVTLQYFETYNPVPENQQKIDFHKMVDAGAVIVSGSQAHRPQAMEFMGSQLIHYGLGNLFFDQMDTGLRGTRNEVIDRHVFYAGRYINTELLTAVLEDYARPRPATLPERAAILNEIFKASQWIP